MGVKKMYSCLRMKRDFSHIQTVAAAITLVTVILGCSEFAKAGIYAERPESKSGKCIKAPDAHASTVLKRNGIKVTGAYNEKDLNGLARAMAQVERIHGGPIPKSWQTTFNFIDSSGAWNQTVPRINVRKNSFGGHNCGALMHEFGHKIANADGQKVFSQYVKSSKPCGITPYSRTSRGEEFGEVFSAFITNPEDLKKKCPSAYGAMTKIFKVKDESTLANCSKPQSPSGPSGQPKGKGPMYSI